MCSSGAGRCDSAGLHQGVESAGGDRFGFSITLTADGNTLAVGAYDEDGSAQRDQRRRERDAPGSGAACRVRPPRHDVDAGRDLKETTTVRNSALGSAVALSADGTTLVVGAVDETSLTRGIDGDENSKQTTRCLRARSTYTGGR